MINLLLIPHPSWKELTISSELLIYGLLVRWMFKKLQTEARREQKRLIRHHVRSGHPRWFATCEPCATQTSLGQPDLLLQPEGSQPELL